VKVLGEANPYVDLFERLPRILIDKAPSLEADAFYHELHGT